MALGREKLMPHLLGGMWLERVRWEQKQPWGLERVVGAQVVILCPLLTSSAQSHVVQGQERGSWCVSAPMEKGLRI